MNRLTGLRRRSEETQHRFAAERAYHYELAAPETVIQSVLRVHDQASKPSCVGQAVSSCEESIVGRWASAVDLWTDAKRRQGSAGNPLDGTDSEHAIESLRMRGCSPYVTGEDTRSTDEDVQLAELGQELAADDARQDPTAEHKTLTSNRTGQAVDALMRGLGVVHGGAVNDAYQALRRDEVIEPADVMGSDGHERRIFGYVKERGLFLELNSWGATWSGVTLLKGFIVPAPFTFGTIVVPAGPLTNALVLSGCAWLSPEALALSWDADAIRIVVTA